MSALRAVPDQGPSSVQGEQVLEAAQRQYADLATVDRYYREVEGTGVDLCRQRGGRHRYPPMPKARPFDQHFSPSGYLIRRTDPCLDCGLAYQIQRYEPYSIGKGRNRIVRFRPAYNTTEYLVGPNGETYQLPRGQGYVHPRDYRDAAATAAVHADPDAQAQAAEALRVREDVLRRRAAARGES